MSSASVVPHRGVLTVCVMLATIMQALDTTIANVALPYMQGSLSATTDQINWVLTSYIVAAAIMTPPTGWLATRFGRKNLFMLAVFFFTLASILCGLAQSLEQMVVFRLLQGVFGASLVPLSQALLLDLYPKERHASAMAIWGMGVMLGPILGPTLGGWLTETYNWRWVFYVNLPIGLLTWGGIFLFLHEAPHPRGRSFDWFGFILLSVAIGSFQLMLDRGEQVDWFESREIIIEATLAALAAFMFAVHTATSDNPFIEPSIFRDRNFSISLVLMGAMGVILFGTMALLTPFLQNLLGYPVLSAGLIMAPRGIGTLFAMLLVGRIAARIDLRLSIVTGLGLTAFALHTMSGFTMDVAQADIIITGMVQGFGMGLIFVPLSAMAFITLPAHARTQGTALFSLVRNIGGSVGISLVIWLLTRNTQIVHSALGEQLTVFNQALKMPEIAHIWDISTVAGRLALNSMVTRQATMIAFLDNFYLMMWLAAAVIPLVFLLRRS